MSKIFVSYRRNDSRWFAGRLYDHLATLFEPQELFMDIDIEPGLNFVEAIEIAVGSCDVLVAVIGPQWLKAADGSGRRLLDSELDWVRLEISTALARGVRVIPCLVEATTMPRTAELPDELIELTHRQAISLSYEHFHRDAHRLTRALKRVVNQQQKGSDRPSFQCSLSAHFRQVICEFMQVCRSTFECW